MLERLHWAVLRDVDVDVKQKFQFGSIGALINDEIDMLVTPDPLPHPTLHVELVFAYEQVLVVKHQHRLAGQEMITPAQLDDETLISSCFPAHHYSSAFFFRNKTHGNTHYRSQRHEPGPRRHRAATGAIRAPLHRLRF